MKLRVAALALALASPATAAPPAIDAPLAACATGVEAAPASYDAYLCFHRLASSGHPLAPIDAWLERNGSPLATVVRAHLKVSRDESKAVTLYRQALAIFATAPHAEGEVVARTNLAGILRRRGDLPAAAAEIDQLAAVARASGEAKLRVRALLAQANFLAETGGDLSQVEAILVEADALLSSAENYTQRRTFLREHAGLRYRQNRRAEAALDYARLRDLASAEKDLREVANATFNLALTRWSELEENPSRSTAELASIESDARAAERAAAAVESATLLHRSSDLLGSLARAGGRIEEARALFELAIERALALEHPDRIASARAARAELALANGEPGAAALEGQARSAMERVDNPRALALLWPWRVRAAWALRPPEEALRESFAGLDAIEALRAAQSAEADRIDVYASWARDYRWLSGRLFERFDRFPNEAFAATERLRTRALRESLRAARIAAPGADSAVATLGDLQAALGVDEAMVLFQIDDDRDAYGAPAGGSWALRVTKSEARAIRLGSRADLEAWSTALLELLERPDELYEATAQRLGQALLGEALAGLPSTTTRLLLVPDGLLHRVPFEVLRPAGPDRPAGRPLGLDFEIALVPSASFLVEERRQRRPEQLDRGGALLFADPRVDPARQATGPVALRDSGPLPYARREARSIVRTFGPASRLRLGAEASETMLRTDLAAPEAAYGVVHFATHAVVDAEDPARSAILLASDATSDGLLTPAEIATLDLTGRLVVLSACRTAAGEAIGGEGPLSLARAFLRAGAAAVVASRWPLRDDEAAEFFDAFHRAGSQGATVAAAARFARRARFEAGSPAGLWAGVAVIGDPALLLPAAEGRQGSPLVRILLLSASLAILVGWGWMARRTRRN